MKCKPLLPIALGLCGAALRFFQCRTIFEPETMLATPHSISLLLPLFLALCALLFAVTAGGKETNLSFSAAFRAPTSARLLGFNFSAFLLIPAGFYLVATHMGGSTLFLIFGALSAVAGACLFLGILGWRRGRPSGTLLLIPVFFSLFWLFVTYQDYASWPVVEAYFVQVLAIAAIAYGFYQVAACAFSQGSRRALRFILPTAVVLCFTALADSTALPIRGMFLACLGALYGFYLSLNNENK